MAGADLMVNGKHYDDSAQRFVDALNFRTMPQLGYEYRNGRWEWPDPVTGIWETRNNSAWGPLIPTGEQVIVIKWLPWWRPHTDELLMRSNVDMRGRRGFIAARPLE